MKVIVKKEDIAAENAALKTRITELELLVKYYEEQFRLSKHKQFGASSEKSQYDTEQLSLFDEAEITADEKVPEPELVEIEKHYRKRKRSAGERLPDDLPVEVIEHALPAEEQLCSECGGDLHVMGHEVRRELKIIPAQAVVVEHKQNIFMPELREEKRPCASSESRHT